MIASKYEKFDGSMLDDLVEFADNAYTKRKDLATEKQLLRQLEFEMGAPTPMHFLRRFWKVAQADTRTQHISKYFVELSTMDYSLTKYLPSAIAAAALLAALSCAKMNSKAAKLRISSFASSCQRADCIH